MMGLLSLPRKLLTKTYVRQLLIVLVLALTIIVFVHFFQLHSEYIRNLGHTNPWLIVAVITLNIPQLLALVLVYTCCLRLCGKRLPAQENFLLTAYSSIINFFGPLQSGPGFRAAYLKVRHSVRLRDYTLATLLYYGLFAFFSALFLLSGTRPWWQTALALLVVVSLSALVIRWYIRHDKAATESQFRLRGNVVALLAVAAFLQVLFMAITYFVELKAVNPHINWGQAVSYTGAANFALFVSLTPDAIGFRESFLYVSQRLHHVSTANILSANVLDRGAYVIFLLLLLVVVFSLHAKDKLRLTSLRK